MAIHPRCEMEENAKIFRICVWLSPIHPPRAADMMAIRVSNVGFSEWDVMYSSAIGGSFMIVDRIRPVMIGDP